MAGTIPTVMTVTGPIQPKALGVTLMHEHVLIDLTCLLAPPMQPWQCSLTEALPTGENRGLLSRDPYVSRPNLLLDEIEVAEQELHDYGRLGGAALVDLTVCGISPRPEALRALSLATGITIVMGCGYYVQRAHPPAVSTTSVEALADEIIGDITDGFGDTGIRPGIIGEIGTSTPIHPDEERVLRAAAIAQRRTGLAINVHVAIFGHEALNVLDILDDTGADLSRVIISHLDEMLDTDYHRAVLRRGAYVEFDTFGSEFSFEQAKRREPTDAERIEALLPLLDGGWDRQILISQDVCTKMHLQRYGGFGYGHILRTVLPMLERRGVTQETIRALLVDNPARVLAHDALPGVQDIGTRSLDGLLD